MRFAHALLVPLVAVAVAFGVVASAEAPIAAAPAPSWARSVEVVDPGTPVLDAPSSAAPRRGTVRQGTRLPLEARVFGEGCEGGAYVRVGDRRYVCETHVAPSPETPSGASWPTVPAGSLLPLHYAFVRHDGALVYQRPSDYFLDEYYESVGDGFGLVVTGRIDHRGVRFLRLRNGRFIPASSVSFARGSSFSGVELEEGEALDLAWVVARSATVLDRPRGRTVREALRREVVHVASVRGGWVELVGGGVLRRAQLRLARLAAPPSEVAPGARWIDVDTDEQVMVLYEGTRPKYATLVSTGRPGRRVETPKGTFRIWAKLAFSDMDNLEQTELSENYAIESVPWVQYFEGANGLHAAFWHDSFGERRSHGCVNLSPADARYVFEFTEPALPLGWEAILPLAGEPSTVVRVR
jgi:hypothetical protein